MFFFFLNCELSVNQRSALQGGGYPHPTV
jgi:hypothetical protein